MELGGSLSANDTDLIQEFVDTILNREERPNIFLVDFSLCPEISGEAAILLRQIACRSNEEGLIVFACASPQIYEAMKKHRIETLFSIHPRLVDALAAFAPPLSFTFQ